MACIQWWFNRDKIIPTKFPICLTDKEQAVLSKYLKTAKIYLEYGSGGSTFLALINSNAKVYSVESDSAWLTHLRTYKIIRNAEKDKRLHLEHINIGQTTTWGTPINGRLRINYPQYSMAIFNQLHKQPIDFIFIDGRFRVACTLAAVAHSSATTRIAIHDYTFRAEYHIVEEFLDIEQIQDTLVIFRQKPNCTQKRLKQMWEKYKFVTD